MNEISDELRRIANSDIVCVCGHTWVELSHLADRIDSEMVELPRSVDGYTWTGGEACFWTGPADGNWHKFDGLHYADGRWCVEDNDFERYPAASVWYERPDSWERIAYDIETVVTIDDEDDERFRHDLADRIRKLAAKEDKRS